MQISAGLYRETDRSRRGEPSWNSLAIGVRRPRIEWEATVSIQATVSTLHAQ